MVTRHSARKSASSPRVRKTPGVCGGDACIRKTRIPVWVLVGYRDLGRRDADLLLDYPGLSAKDLEAAWAYAEENPEEIRLAIAENENA